jgi:hypothetical protein
MYLGMLLPNLLWEGSAELQGATQPPNIAEVVPILNRVLCCSVFLGAVMFPLYLLVFRQEQPCSAYIFFTARIYCIFVCASIEWRIERARSVYVLLIAELFVYH